MPRINTVIGKLDKLRRELTSVNSGISFFQTKNERLVKVLEVEKMKIEHEIDELEEKIESCETEIIL